MVVALVAYFQALMACDSGYIEHHGGSVLLSFDSKYFELEKAAIAVRLFPVAHLCSMTMRNIDMQGLKTVSKP